MKVTMFDKIAHTPSISHEEWLALRKTGIGGSDAGAILGLNKYSTAFSVYLDKLGLISEKEDSEAMRQGRDLEEYVAQRFAEKEGKVVRRFNYLIRSKQYPFAIADIDRIIVGENAILECKTTSVRNPTNFEGGDIPEYWYCQVQHYLAVTGCDVCYLAVIVLGQAYYCFRIERNEEEIAALMEFEREFWEGCVLDQKEPLPDGSASASEVIGKMYAHSNDETDIVDLTPFSEKCMEYDRLKGEIDALTAKRDAIKQEIQLYLKAAATGTFDGGKVSWKTQTRTGIDSKRLKAERPEIYEQYATQTVSRPFNVTIFKEE